MRPSGFSGRMTRVKITVLRRSYTRMSARAGGK
jgi:hypothetical protein